MGKPRIAAVLGGGVGCPVAGDVTADAHIAGNADFLEVFRKGAIRRPHIEITLGAVVNRQIPNVGIHQLAGTMHDGLQRMVEVADCGQVLRGLDHGIEPAFALLVFVETLADHERHLDALLQCFSRLSGRSGVDALLELCKFFSAGVLVEKHHHFPEEFAIAFRQEFPGLRYGHCTFLVIG
jgi:hypothetical protein